MHDTLIPNVKGFIDEMLDIDKGIVITGWICTLDEFITYIKIEVDGNKVPISSIERPDVAAVYNRQDINLGFKTIIPKNCNNACILISEDGIKFVPVMNIQGNNVISEVLKTSNDWKSFICVDNFYDYPDKVREFALSQNYVTHPDYHRGSRTDLLFRPEFIKEKFESLIGKKITTWNRYGTNGCFQYCTSTDPVVYHYDGQNYAGVVYLTPNAPFDCGTSFYRSKITGLMKVPDSDPNKSFEQYQDETFKTGFYDATQFDKIDTVGNVYNRLVLWDAKLLHAASGYFGNKLENSRLFHLFFFDVDN